MKNFIQITAFLVIAIALASGAPADSDTAPEVPAAESNKADEEKTPIPSGESDPEHEDAASTTASDDAEEDECATGPETGKTDEKPHHHGKKEHQEHHGHHGSPKDHGHKHVKRAIGNIMEEIESPSNDDETSEFGLFD